MRWLLLIVLVLDVLAPFVAAFALARLVRRLWPIWKSYLTVSAVFTLWTLITMYGVGHNLTSYVVVVPIAIALGVTGAHLRDAAAVPVLVVLVWVVVPTAACWLVSRLRHRMTADKNGTTSRPDPG